MSVHTRWKNWKLRRRRQHLEKEAKLVRVEARQMKNDEIYEESPDNPHDGRILP